MKCINDFVYYRKTKLTNMIKIVYDNTVSSYTTGKKIWRIGTENLENWNTDNPMITPNELNQKNRSITGTTHIDTGLQQMTLDTPLHDESNVQRSGFKPISAEESFNTIERIEWNISTRISKLLGWKLRPVVF